LAVETPPSIPDHKDHDMKRTFQITDPAMIQRIARQMAENHPGTVVVLGGHKEAAR
jgi:hypothetical protein